MNVPDEAVSYLVYELGLTDTQVADRLATSTTKVCGIRERLGLKRNYGGDCRRIDHNLLAMLTSYGWSHYRISTAFGWPAKGVQEATRCLPRSFDRDYRMPYKPVDYDLYMAVRATGLTARATCEALNIPANSAASLRLAQKIAGGKVDA